MQHLNKQDDPEFTRLQMKCSTVTLAVILLILSVLVFMFLIIVT